MPVGAFGGRRDIMQKIARSAPCIRPAPCPAVRWRWRRGWPVSSRLPARFLRTLTARTTRLVAGLTAAAAKHGVTFTADSVGGMFGLVLREARPRATPTDGVGQGQFQPILPCDASTRAAILPVGFPKRASCRQARSRSGHRFDRRWLPEQWFTSRGLRFRH